MLISNAKAMYFWHRQLEEKTLEYTLRKWNTAYPDDQISEEDAAAFLADMNRRVKAGQRDGAAMYCIMTGQETLGRPEPMTEEEIAQAQVKASLEVHVGEPPTAELPVVEKAKRKLFAKKEK